MTKLSQKKSECAFQWVCLRRDNRRETYFEVLEYFGTWEQKVETWLVLLEWFVWTEVFYVVFWCKTGVYTTYPTPNSRQIFFSRVGGDQSRAKRRMNTGNRQLFANTPPSGRKLLTAVLKCVITLIRTTVYFYASAVHMALNGFMCRIQPETVKANTHTHTHSHTHTSALHNCFLEEVTVVSKQHYRVVTPQ